jgi:hypothetical protein
MLPLAHGKYRSLYLAPSCVRHFILWNCRCSVRCSW